MIFIFTNLLLADVIGMYIGLIDKCYIRREVKLIEN